MKVKVKSAYLDQDGLHKKNDIVEVKKLDPIFHVPVEEEKEEKKPAKTSSKSKK